MTIRYSQILTFLIIILLVLGLSNSNLKAETLGEAQVADLYAQAKDFFRQANELAALSPVQAEDLYGKAAMRYERHSKITYSDKNNIRILFFVEDFY